jgi:hypothetical protein
MQAFLSIEPDENNGDDSMHAPADHFDIETSGPAPLPACPSAVARCLDTAVGDLLEGETQQPWQELRCVNPALRLHS